MLRNNYFLDILFNFSYHSSLSFKNDFERHFCLHHWLSFDTGYNLAYIEGDACIMGLIPILKMVFQTIIFRNPLAIWRYHRRQSCINPPAFAKLCCETNLEGAKKQKLRFFKQNARKMSKNLAFRKVYGLPDYIGVAKFYVLKTEYIGGI